MFKKIFFITMMTLFCLTTTWSQTWVGLTKSAPAEPETTVTRSDNQQVSFTVELSGFFATTKTEAGISYQRLSIPGCGAAGATGEPELPVIVQRIAIPACSQVHYSVQITESQLLSGYMVYPVPELQPDGNGILQEVFTIDLAAYQKDTFTPAQNYTLGETGSLRNQHFITIEVNPIQFNPISGTLQVATEIKITLTFDNPTTAVNVATGIFNNVATHTLLNYQDQGIKASINDKAFEKANFIPGKVKWITITDPAQADTIACDYLIICAAPFFEPNNPNSEVLRIATHRANYNGFSVAILNIDDILSENVGFYFEEYDEHPGLYYEYKTEQRYRTCIRLI